MARVTGTKSVQRDGWSLFDEAIKRSDAIIRKRLLPTSKLVLGSIPYARPGSLYERFESKRR